MRSLPTISCRNSESLSVAASLGGKIRLKQSPFLQIERMDAQLHKKI
jgi:hypothetical protein